VNIVVPSTPDSQSLSPDGRAPGDRKRHHVVEASPILPSPATTRAGAPPAAGVSLPRGGWQVARWANPQRRGDGCPRTGTPGSVAEEGLLVMLCRTADAVRRRVQREVLAPERLSWTAFEALNIVAAHDGIDPAGVAGCTGTDQAAVRGAVGGLVAAGYLQPVACGTGRLGGLRLTPTGALLAGYLRQRVDSVQTQLIGTGGPGCLLRRLATHLQPTPPPGQSERSPINHIDLIGDSAP
jgi:hypothetical protein